MSLIDITYFQGQLSIAQRGQPQVAADIQNYIDRYETEFLTAALGYDLMTDFLNGIAEDAPAQIWLDIRDGCTFKNTSGWWPAFYAAFPTCRPLYNSNQNLKWYGFAGQANSVAQPSPEAAYIYYQYMVDLNTQNTGMGVVKAKGESAVGMPNHKLVDRWNNMSDQIVVLWQLLATRGQSVYGNYFVGNIDYRFFERQNLFGI
jgi:hypothetical protein